MTSSSLAFDAGIADDVNKFTDLIMQIDLADRAFVNV